MKRILIVEDQSLVRAAMRELILISEPNAIISGVGTYLEAVSQLHSKTFEYAFIDIDLKSSQTGKDLLKYIKEYRMEINAVMLSAHLSRELILECLRLGACGFISKYADEDDIFRHAIDTIMQGLPYISFSRDCEKFEVDFFQPAEAKSLISFGVQGRSAEVLSYLCKGYSNKTIARKMKIEEGTIRKNYVPKLFRIFKVSRRVELLIEVSRLGVSVPDFE